MIDKDKPIIFIFSHENKNQIFQLISSITMGCYAAVTKKRKEPKSSTGLSHNGLLPAHSYSYSCSLEVSWGLALSNPPS